MDNKLTTENKRALLAQLLKKKAAQPPPLTPRDRPDQAIPLSFGQRRLWFLDQIDPGRSVYNINKAMRLKGALDVPALERSLNAIVARHESLRTVFAMTGEEPVQVIRPSVRLSLTCIDLRELPAEAREAEMQRHAQAERNRPFDLSSGPLMRAALLRLGEQEYVLILAVHHIVSDGWSMNVLSREIETFYSAYSKETDSGGDAAPLLPAPAIQYADFAIWQRRWLQGKALESQLDYWREKLAGDLPLLELPADRPRPLVQDFQGHEERRILSPALSGAIKALARRAGSTLFMVMLAAFQLLLARLSGQDDIIVGAPIAGRKQIETESLIGLFLSTVVLRGDLSGNPTFNELLQRVSKMSLDAYDHQELPFETLVEELQPQRSLGRNPIFDVLINLNNAPQKRPLDLPGIDAEPLERLKPQSKFAMTLYLRDEGQHIELRLVYQSALFSTLRMTHFADQLQYLLEQIAAAPQQRIQSYSLVTTAARLPDPSAPIAEPAYRLTHSAIAGWARAAPSRTAVVDHDGRHCSYAELWNAATSIAQALRARGLRNKDVVAISGVKSPGLIAAMAGALASGGVMLTLDRKFPAERQHLLLREAGARHLVYVGAQRSEDRWMSGIDLAITRVAADLPMQSGAASFTDLPAPAISGDDPAYIFFTSGTTGVPKGVLGNHKGLSHFLTWQRAAFGISEDDRVAQLTALSFDVLLRDVFLPLTSGASLHLPDENEGVVSSYVVPWLARERISVLHTVPALAQSWLADEPQAPLPDLRWTFFSGEPLTDALIAKWRAAFGASGGIVNLYGPTETTMVKCFHRVVGEEPLGAQPVGRPLPETQVFILNANGGLCGIGEPGEIVIRTPFRTLGYVNGEEQTARRFIRNPFRDDDQDLIYLTGDRGRYRPDGVLTMEGRLDDQVKINGVRVEPGEAAAVLAQHPSLQAAFVMARKNGEGANFLAAYVVARGGESVTIAELRVFLSGKLPPPLAPSTFNFLAALPLRPNGKVDRKALPAPDDASVDPARIFVAPSTPNEIVLAGIWAEVLKLDKIGIDENFFELGGHSLLATQVVSRARRALEIELPLRALFETPTIAGLAAAVIQSQMAKVDEDEVTRFLAQLESSSAQVSDSEQAASCEGEAGIAPRLE